MEIVKYETEEERQEIINKKNKEGFTLIEIQNVTDGNFLGFIDEEELIKRKELIKSQSKDVLIKHSKALLEEYLEENPLLFNGKYYSVTKEKQSLLTGVLAVYQISVALGLNPVLKWNAVGEVCTEWSIEDLSALAIAISDYVTPLISKQQVYEIQIANCEITEEFTPIVIDYNK